MAKGFNLTAEINLRGPANLKSVAAQIRRELGVVTGNVKLNIDAKSAKNIDVINKKLNTLNTTLARARQGTIDLNTALGQLGASLSSVGNSSVSISGNMSKTGGAAASTAKNLNMAASAMESFGKQSALAIKRFAAFSVVTSGVYALVNAITSGFKAFIEFDKQMIVLQQVTGAGTVALKGLESEITNLSINLGVASEDLLSVASTLAQAGLTAEETRIALKALAKTELAPSFENLTKTTEGAIAAIRQFGLEATELEGALGSINAVAAAFAVESGDIIAAIQRTGGVFAAASKGVSEGTDALNEFIAVFTSVRQTTRESAETIATGLRTIFTRIQRADTIRQLREFGIELTDIEGKFVGPYEAIKRLSEGLKTLDPRDIRFSTIIEELGGFRQVGKVIPLIQQFSTAQKALAVAQKGQSSLTDAQAIAQKSLAFQLAQVRNQFVALIRDVGKSTAFQTLFKFVINLSKGLITLAGAFKPILPLLGILATIKGAKALAEFAGGFFGAFKGAGGAKGVGSNIGGTISGTKEKDKSDTMSKAAAAIRDNTSAVQSLTTAIQSLEATINSRSGGPTFNRGGKVYAFARGGVVPGSGNRDTVPAMLQPGEFVIRKKAVETIGADNLHGMNKYGSGGSIRSGKTKKRQKFAGGGVAQIKNKGARDGDSWSVDYIPSSDPISVTTRGEGYDAYEITKGKAWEKALGARATEIASKYFTDSSEMSNQNSLFKSLRQGKFASGRPIHKVPGALKRSMFNEGVAKPAKQDNTATGSGGPTSKQMETLEKIGFNTRNLQAKNLGGLIQKFMAGGKAKETRPFGSGSFPFPKRISNAYFRELDDITLKKKQDEIFGGGIFGLEETRIRVDDQEASEAFSRPFDRAKFFDTFKQKMVRSQVYQNMSDFAKFIGLPPEDFSLALPANIDFAKKLSGSGFGGASGQFDRTGMGVRGVEGYDLSGAGFTSADEQDLYGYQKLIDEKRKQVQKIIKTPTKTYDDGSFDYDSESAKKVWAEVNDLEMKVYALKTKKADAEKKIQEQIQETAKQTGRGTVSMSSGPLSLKKNDTFYHELTHQLFQGLRTRSADTFDKYKSRVVSLFEGPNGDALADAFDALENSYNSADVVYGRSYKIGLLDRVIANNARGSSERPASTPTAPKEAYDAWGKALGVKKAREFKPLNPVVNKALLDNSISQSVIDRVEDSGKEEFLTTLVQNAPKLDANLQGVLNSTISELLSSAGIQRQAYADGGKVLRNLGYIDYDVIANEANKDIVEKGMATARVTGPRLYADYLTDLAVKARKSKSLDKLRAIYGVAGSGKTTLARGQGTDQGTLRQTNRFPILSPEDIEKANEILILTSSVSRDKLEGYLSEVDRAYTLSSTTASERDRVRTQRTSRDVSGIGLEGRQPGTTSGVSTDTAVGEALLGNALGERSVVLGRSSTGGLRRKKGDELVDIIKKKIAFTWGGFAPTTAGHESIMDAAAAMGFAPEDFIALVGANEGIKAGDPSSYRTAVFDQDFRVLLAKAGFGARGATVLPKPRDFEVPQAFDLTEEGGDRRRVLIPGRGSRAFVADKTAEQMAKYKEAGYAVTNLERTGGISGTMVRDLVMAGDMAKLQEVLSPGVYELISANIGRLRNRANILPSIIEQVQASQGSSLAALDQEIAAVGIKRIDSKKVASDPEYAAKAQLLEELRAKKKKLQSAAGFEPYRLLSELARSQPDKYGLDTTVSAPSLSTMTGVRSGNVQAKSLGGLIRQFEDAGAVSSTGGKPVSRSDILKVLGAQGAAEAAGISSTEVYTLLGLRNPNAQQTALREAIEKEYVKKVNRKAGAKKGLTTRLQNRGFEFGAAGLLGEPSPPTNIDITSDRISRSVKARVVSGVLKKDVAEQIDAMFTTGSTELARRAAETIRAGYGETNEATGDIVPSINTEASIQGGLLEKAVQMLGGPGAVRGQGFDFPDGLQGAAKYFGLPEDIPTDLKRTLEGPKTIQDNIVTYLKNVMGYNSGGTVYESQYRKDIEKQVRVLMSQIGDSKKRLASFRTHDVKPGMLGKLMGRSVSNPYQSEIWENEEFIARAEKQVAELSGALGIQAFAAGGPVKLYHGTMTGPEDSTLKSIKEKGILSTLASGHGQGSGFYVWTSRDSAVNHSRAISKNEIVTNAAKGGYPMVIELTEALDPRNWDLDYEIQAGDIANFVFDNFEKAQALLEKAKGIDLGEGMSDFTLRNKNAEFKHPAAGKTVRQIGLGFKESGIDRRLSVDTLGYDYTARTGQVLGGLVRAMRAGDPTVLDAFEEQFFANLQPGQALKYVGSAPLTPSNIEVFSTQPTGPSWTNDPSADIRLKKGKDTRNYGQIGLTEDTGMINVGYYKNDERSGYLSAYKLRDYLYYVGDVRATGGYGPRLYDVAMEAVTEKGAMLTSDRTSVSDDAKGVWSTYFNSRPDVRKTPLKPDDWTKGSLLDPKLYGREETWPPATDPAWILQSGYSKTPELIRDPEAVKISKKAMGGLIQRLAAGGNVESLSDRRKKLPSVNQVGAEMADQLKLVKGPNAYNQADNNCLEIAMSLAKKFGYEADPEKFRAQLKLFQEVRASQNMGYGIQLTPEVLKKNSTLRRLAKDPTSSRTEASLLVREGDELMKHVSLEVLGKEYNYGAAGKDWPIILRVPVKKKEETAKDAIKKFAKGGSAEDTVPALLTPGEFVINKKAAKQIGYSRLEKLNQADKIQGYNKGGYVGIRKFAAGGGVFSADERELVASRAKAKGITFNAEVAEMRKAILDAAKDITNIRPKQDALRALSIENKERLKNIRAKATAEKRAIREDLKSGKIDKTQADQRRAKVDKDLKLQTRGIENAIIEQMKAIDPRLGAEQLKKLSGELMSGLAAGMNLDDIISRSSELTSVFRGTISAAEAQRIVTERLSEEMGVAVTSLEQLAPAADIARQQLATEQEATFGQLGRLFPELTAAFESSAGGGQFTEFAQGLSTENITAALDRSLSSRLGPALGSGIAEKLGGVIGGLGGPIAALGAGVAVLGNTIPTIGEGLDSLLGSELSDSPAFAGLAGGVTGAGQYGASGAALGAQVGGAPGALVGAIAGAIYGAVKGSITAALTKELENGLSALTESTAKADKALQEFEKNNTYTNLGKVEGAAGEQLASANALNKFANANRGIDRFIPIFSKFWISSAQQAEALSAQQQALVKVLESNTVTARGRVERMSDADLTKASEAVKGTNAEFARSSTIIDSYTRSIIKQRNGNIAANESVDEYIRKLDSTGQARVKGIQDEARVEAARAAFIAERRQLGDSEADAQKKWLDGGQEAIDAGLKLVKEREEEILSAERLARAVNKATVAQERLLDIYRRMGASLDRLSKELDKVVADADAYAAAASGEGKVREMDTSTLDVLENISAYSMEEVRAAGTNVSGLLGGTPEAKKLGDTAVAAKVIQDQLPALLATTGGKDVESIVGTLETQLTGLIGDTPESKTVINEALGEVRKKLESQGDEKSFEELSKDANFLSQVSDSVKAGLETQAKVAKTYIESMNKVIDVTNKMNEALTKADGHFMKAGEIRINSEIELSRTLGKSVSLKDMNKSFETEIRSLTRNIAPGGTLDVGTIYRSAAATSEQISAPMPGVTGQTTDAQVRAIDKESAARGRAVKANNDAISALKRLAEDGSRAANALSLIKENQQLASNSSDFLRKALTSNAEELADMTVDVKAYTMAVSGTAGPSQFQNLEFRQQAFRGFDLVGQMLPEDLRGRIGAGLSMQMLEATNPALLDEVAYRGKDKEGNLTSVTYRQALEEQASGKLGPETQALVDTYNEATQAQIDANNALGLLQLESAARYAKTRDDLLREISGKLNGLVDRTREQVKQDAAAAAAAAPKTGPDMTPEKTGPAKGPDAAAANASGNWEVSPTAVAGITAAGLAANSRPGRAALGAIARPLRETAGRVASRFGFGGQQRGAALRNMSFDDIARYREIRRQNPRMAAADAKRVLDAERAQRMQTSSTRPESRAYRAGTRARQAYEGVRARVRGAMPGGGSRTPTGGRPSMPARPATPVRPTRGSMPRPGGGGGGGWLGRLLTAGATVATVSAANKAATGNWIPFTGGGGEQPTDGGPTTPEEALSIAEAIINIQNAVINIGSATMGENGPALGGLPAGDGGDPNMMTEAEYAAYMQEMNNMAMQSMQDAGVGLATYAAGSNVVGRLAQPAAQATTTAATEATEVAARAAMTEGGETAAKTVIVEGGEAAARTAATEAVETAARTAATEATEAATRTAITEGIETAGRGGASAALGGGLRGLRPGGATLATGGLVATDLALAQFGGPEGVFGQEGTVARETYDTARAGTGAGVVAVSGPVGVAANTVADALYTSYELISKPNEKLAEWNNDTTALDNFNQNVEAFGPVVGTMTANLQNAAGGLARPIDTIGKGITQGGGLVYDSFSAVAAQIKTAQMEIAANESRNKSNIENLGSESASIVGKLSTTEQMRAQEQAALTAKVTKLREIKAGGGSIADVEAAGLVGAGTYSDQNGVSALDIYLQQQEEQLAGMEAYFAKLRENEKDYSWDFSSNMNSDEFKAAVQVYLSQIAAQAAQEASARAAETVQTEAITTPETTPVGTEQQILSGGAVITNASTTGGSTGVTTNALELAQAIINIQNAVINIGSAAVNNASQGLSLSPDSITSDLFPMLNAGMDMNGLPISPIDLSNPDMINMLGSMDMGALFGGDSSIQLNTDALNKLSEVMTSATQLNAASLPMMIAQMQNLPSFGGDLAPIGANGEMMTYMQKMQEVLASLDSNNGTQAPKSTTTASQQPAVAPLNTVTDYNKEIEEMAAETLRTGQPQTRGYDLRDKPAPLVTPTVSPPPASLPIPGGTTPQTSTPQVTEDPRLAEYEQRLLALKDRYDKEGASLGLKSEFDKIKSGYAKDFGLPATAQGGYGMDVNKAMAQAQAIGEDIMQRRSATAASSASQSSILPDSDQTSLAQTLMDMMPIDQLRELAAQLDPSLTGSAANYLTPEDLADIINKANPDQLSNIAPGLLAQMQQMQQSMPGPAAQQEQAKRLPFDQDPRKAADARYVAKRKEIDKGLQDAMNKTLATGEETTVGFDLREPQDCCDRLAGLLQQILNVLQESKGMATGTSMVDSVTNGIPSILDMLSSGWNTISDAANNGLGALSDMASGAFNRLFGVTEPVEGVETPAQAFMNSIGDSFSSLFSMPGNMLNSMMGYDESQRVEGFESPAEAFTNSITSSLSSVGSSISSFFSNIFGQNTSLGPAGLAAGVPAVVGAAPSIATSMLSGGGMDIEGLLRTMQLLNTISSGLNTGVSSGTTGMLSSSMGLAGAGLSMMNPLQSSPTGIAGSVPAIVDSLSSGLQSVFATFITDFQNSLTNPGAAPGGNAQAGNNLLSIDEKTVQFLDSFQKSLDGFGKYVGDLSTAAAQLPDKIEFNGNYNFGVTITGAEAFEQMGVNLKDEIKAIFQPQIDNLYYQTIGGLGKSPNRPTTNKKP